MFGMALALNSLICVQPNSIGSFENPIDNEVVVHKNKNEFELMKKMAAYNTWANQQLVEWLDSADSTQWIAYVESSFSTLELTVRHLWNAEFAWLTTLKKEPWRSAIEKDEVMRQKDILYGFLKTSSDFEKFVQVMNDADFNEVRKIGKDGVEVTLADIIQHVFNHATYHRGQLITMGRQLGLTTPPRTDYIYFLTK
jgi:uncharacterized damage-inducible protein DinB